MHSTNQAINKAIEIDSNNELIKYTAGLIYYYSAYSLSALPNKIEPWPEPPITSLIKSDPDSIQMLEKAGSLFNQLIENTEKLIARGGVTFPPAIGFGMLKYA